jgi:hypothetical protein
VLVHIELLLVVDIELELIEQRVMVEVDRLY